MSGIFGYWRLAPGAGGPAAEAAEKMAGVIPALTDDVRWEAPDGGLIGTRGPAAGLYHAPDLSLACVLEGPDAGSDSAGAGSAERLAALYREQGWQALERLPQEAVLAVMDHARQRLWLRCDRIGRHLLYFAQHGDGLAFASDARALRALQPRRHPVDHQALLNYLFFQMVPAPYSAFAGIRRLLPAEMLEFRDGRARRAFYWHIDYSPSSADAGALEAEFQALMRAGVERALYREASGCFLSGGTDSSTVSGWASRLRRPMPTYSIGFDAEGYDETGYARIATRHFGLDNHEYYVTPDDVVEAVPMVAAAYDAPFGNASAIPAYYCARRAAGDGIALMLAGDGGDEIFGGNARYVTQQVFELYQHLPGWLRAGLIEPLAFALPGAGLMPVRKLRSYLRQAKVPLPDRLETYNFLHNTPPREIIEAEFLDDLDTQVPVLLMREVYQRTQGEDTLDRMLHLDMKITLADNDLRKVTRMCTLAGVEVSFPMLDLDLVEFAGHVPPGLKIKGRRLRHFFKEAVRDFLPREIIDKSKHGFGLPFGLWLRDHAPLHELARDSLEALIGRGLLRRDYVERLWQQHAGIHPGYYGVMIWILMMLEQWLRAHNLELD